MSGASKSGCLLGRWFRLRSGLALLRTDLEGGLQTLPAERALLQEAVGEGGRDALAGLLAPEAGRRFVVGTELNFHGDSPE